MSYENNNINRDNNIMDWNDIIENDGQEYFLLPDGDYDFTVTGFERGRFAGSAKIPACNKAVLTLTVTTPDGTANVKTDIILYRTIEWRVSSFFRSIGAKKQGERLVMDWSKVFGATGRARFKQRTYIGTDGKEHTAVDVDKFFDSADKPGTGTTKTETVTSGSSNLPFDDDPFGGFTL